MTRDVEKDRGTSSREDARELPRVNCQCCGSARWHHYARKWGYRVWRCQSCGSGQVYPLPGRDLLAGLYGLGYYKSSCRAQGYADYEADWQVHQLTAQIRVPTIRRYLEVATPRVLDIGCGSGHFLRATDAGWKRFGIEISAFAAKQAARDTGVDIVVGSAESLPLKGGFDLVTMWDVIEHLPNPGLALREIRRVLDPNGLLVASTGDFTSLVARVTGPYWYLLTPPTHLHFFSSNGFRELLECNGFSVLRLERGGKYVSARLMRHLMCQSAPGIMGRLFSAMLGRGRSRHVFMNLFDQMTAYARPLDVVRDESRNRVPLEGT